MPPDALGHAGLATAYLLAALVAMAASGAAFLALHGRNPWLSAVFGA